MIAYQSLLVRLITCLFALGTIFLSGCSNNEEVAKSPSVVTKKISGLKRGNEVKAGAIDNETAQKKTVAASDEAEQDKMDNPLIAAYEPTYNPKGKINPFTPPFGTKTKEKEQKNLEKRPKRVPQHPLEKVDISQLKLVSILRGAKGNIAMVEEATGRGYVIERGTPIGINWGYVAEIDDRKVIVEEEVEDVLGNIVKQKKELTLPASLEE